MKAVTAFAMLIALGAPLCAFPGASAQAKISPLESQASVTALDESAYSRLAARLEADYFRAQPSPPLVETNYLCRLQLRVFEKMRLAQSCN